MTAKINKCWKQLNCLQPDVQEGGRRPVQEQTQQWADDVSHEGQSDKCFVSDLFLICITFFESHEGQSETFFVSADILNPFKWRSVGNFLN